MKLCLKIEGGPTKTKHFKLHNSDSRATKIVTILLKNLESLFFKCGAI